MPAEAWSPFDIIHPPQRRVGSTDVLLGARLKFLRMKPGHGEVLLTEGDPRVRDDEERLVAEFRRQLDEGMWAAVPVQAEEDGRREARMVKEYAEIPAEADRVIFFPRAAGGGVVRRAARSARPGTRGRRASGAAALPRGRGMVVAAGAR